MPNLEWSISHLHLGKIAEYYAQAEFLSYGYEVYDTVVDDRGIDFLARKGGEVYEVQVKAVRNYNYTFILKDKMKDKMKTLSDNRLVCYLNFLDGQFPEIYVIPATAWERPNAVLTDKDYLDQKSKPEYGINASRKNMNLLEPYLSDHYFKTR